MASLFWSWFCFSDVFVDKRHVAPNLNLVNVLDLNKVLRSKVFVSKDRQLRAVHLILDFEPLSNKFQDVDHPIRARDPRLARIDVSVLGFLAREDIMPVVLPPPPPRSLSSQSCSLKRRDSFIAAITRGGDRLILSRGRRRGARKAYDLGLWLKGWA